MTMSTLRHYRKRVGLSQDQLAEMIGTSQGTIAHIERGHTKYSAAIAFGLANAFASQGYNFATMLEIFCNPEKSTVDFVYKPPQPSPDSLPAD